MPRQSIYSLNQEGLKSILTQWGLPAFHSRQIFAWLYKKKTESFSAMSNLPAVLRQRLQENFFFSELELKKRLASSDGTEKFLLKLSDGNLIEAVAIPAAGRVTACLSTQAGCKYACKFCASGKLGFKRNLDASEIIAELLLLMKHSAHPKITHIVFMGVGEPLDNYANLLKAIRIINDKDGLNIGARRITISTCGVVPGIKRLSQEGLQVELSVSLHAATDEKRSLLMPVNKKYPLKELIQTCREYIQETNRQITFEYVLIRGFNSSLQDAEVLSKIMQGLRLAKVNLIPSNIVEGNVVLPPEKAAVMSFRDYLIKKGVPATLRKARGEDIEAACGQLRLRYEKI